MTIQQIQTNIIKLTQDLYKETFIFDFLLAFGTPKASISRLEKGDYNKTKELGELVWKDKIYFLTKNHGDLHLIIDEIKTASHIKKHRPRFLLVTDFDALLAIDTKTNDSLDIKIKELPKYFDFFLPLAGMEKSQVQGENPADIKAAEKLGKLYDIILHENSPKTEADWHALNVFLSRLLFCFFAEDTDIFPQKIFSNGIASHTAEDGSDLDEYLAVLFKVLNTKERKNLPQYLSVFPYVNGGLFREELPIPKFNSKSWQIILDCGNLNWAEINPDIFGSMIQAVVHRDKRGDLGIHYTSVTNILKVIEPLFIEDLREELQLAGNNKAKLNNLLERIYKIRIFDPACGSGNFLVIAYKELCKLEIETLKRIHGEQVAFNIKGKIALNQFYGIEIDDFASETTKLSLYIAEHQMNLAFGGVFGHQKPTLPLQSGSNIFCGNATRMKWEDICPKNNECETYVIGNPPYVGTKNQSLSQKSDMKFVLKNISQTKSLDYIACWFLLASNYIDEKSKFSFVSTNSIFQGTQVPLLWPLILKDEFEIFFCHKDFLWTNNAKNKAGVTCSIVGIRKIEKSKPKYIIEPKNRRKVTQISPYLIDSRTVFVLSRSNSISKLPKLQNGNQPYDGGHLLFSPTQKEAFLEKFPSAKKYFKKLVGSLELINGKSKWCLWIEDSQLEEAMKISGLAERIKNVRSSREKGGSCARSCQDRPHQFRWVNRAKKVQIVLPIVSSQRRHYIPMSYVDKETIVSNKAQAIYDADLYVFGILNSHMHMVWVSTITGRLKSDYSYTAGLCYNCFPMPELTTQQKTNLENLSFDIIEAREKYPELTLAKLYDPLKMPPELLTAHKNLDNYVDTIYRRIPFRNDDERIEHLFSLYESMTQMKKVK